MKGEVHGHLTSTVLVTLSLQLSDIQSVANTFSLQCKGSVDGKLPKKSTIHTTGSPELVELPWPATIEMKTESQQILSCKPSGKCENASLMLPASSSYASSLSSIRDSLDFPHLGWFWKVQPVKLTGGRNQHGQIWPAQC